MFKKVWPLFLSLLKDDKYPIKSGNAVFLNTASREINDEGKERDADSLQGNGEKDQGKHTKRVLGRETKPSGEKQ